ncbi:MAG: hypothetical protein HN674_08645 [Candidatus Marinimicrobia bacterium]|jgi:hypothetical protein|nr:hypothetical protein [Candidatus Neomarinimicrobiota bacterium]MBT3501542.1 hypothetical protein [Candidatus Neomarinimicrobiota bacterium]MBT3839674.1 hypothetical protein [Candidatus Neomarinimicrobiota bacterium]MBT4282677.1 hypothetical protein [Candidatus Neomarinimicrobiota bacterium]MBT4580043.1 hypothetical protein [Candidatus Neomarinimicrobiota bacterium]
MKKALLILLLSNLLIAGDKDAFTIEIRPRVIDDAKILINVQVVNHVGRPVDYLEGFLSKYSGDKEFLDEDRMVLVYNYEPALQTGFSTTKTTSYPLVGDKPPTYKFTISKVKFSGENRIFAWHPKAGFIRID